MSPENEMALASEDTSAAADELQTLLERADGSDYVDQVVELYEESERNYRAAVTSGAVIYGFSDRADCPRRSLDRRPPRREPLQIPAVRNRVARRARGARTLAEQRRVGLGRKVLP